MLGLEPAGAPRAPEAPPAFRPILARSLFAACTLALEALLSALLVLFCGLRVALIGRLQTGQEVSAAELEANDGAVLFLSRAAIPLLVLTATAFLLWFHRAHANLRAFRRDTFQFTPRDAALSFVIPFVNLVRPPAVMAEIWRASDPAIPPFSETPWSGARSSALVPVWWALFLLRGLVGWGATFAARAPARPDLESIRTGARFLTFESALGVGAAAAAIALIVAIQRRQEALEGMPPAPAAMPVSA